MAVRVPRSNNGSLNCLEPKGDQYIGPYSQLLLECKIGIIFVKYGSKSEHLLLDSKMTLILEIQMLGVWEPKIY